MNHLDVTRKINIHLFCSLHCFSSIDYTFLIKPQNILQSFTGWRWRRVEFKPILCFCLDTRMKCCLEYGPVPEGLLGWRGKDFDFAYVFEEIPFDWHILVYKSRENIPCTRESPKEHKFFPHGKWCHTGWEDCTATWLSTLKVRFQTRSLGDPKEKKNNWVHIFKKYLSHLSSHIKSDFLTVTWKSFN